ncbi:MAG: MBL fold metallo-hydrolase [Bacteroidales bacterium]|nr:MBL fold metallo-hydrolase [Bacteroidales bacterium]
MKTICIFLLSMIMTQSHSQSKFQSDAFQTEMGELLISFVGHGTLMLQIGNTIIHIDPVSREADYNEMPEADLILITHQHGDHLDMAATGKILKKETKLVLTQSCLDMLEMDDAIDFEVMRNGDIISLGEIKIEAIPAYNIEHKRSNGTAYHPKGEGNGYILNFGDFRVLVAGDTENIPEIKSLKNIDIAFLPMNLPYTMTPEMVADAAKSFKPKVLYPYHFGNTDTNELIVLMKECKQVEVRIREF